MSDNTEQIDESQFSYGLKGNPPTMLVIVVPIKAWAEQGADGLDMFYGKMKRMEAVGAQLIKEEFMRRKQNGVIRPNNNGPTLGVA